MKKIAIFTIIAMGLSAPAYAGDHGDANAAGAIAGATGIGVGVGVGSAQSGALAAAQGGNVTFNTPSQQAVHYSGTQTIRSAPQVVPPGFSSGHPCAYAPISVGLSVVGFGGALGGQRVDNACLLAQMGVGNAAMLMIAQRDPAACQALMAVGRVRSCGGYRVATSAASYQPATRVSAKKVAYTSLKKGQLYRKTPGGKLYRKG